MTDREPIAGTEYVISAGGYTASIVSVGATLRSLEFEGRDLVVPYGLDEVRPGYRGVILAPWPNRVIDGTYEFGGETHQLALTEPARGHALHGLVVWQAFQVVEQSAERVVLDTIIEPQAGYPWRVRVEVEYVVSAAGLATAVRATNLSTEPAPFGTGPHPYLVAPEGRVNDWTLSLPATTVVTITPERLLPLEHIAVPAELSFVEARPIGEVFIDHAYSGLQWDAQGSVTATVTDVNGAGAGMRWAADCPWVQIHTADNDVEELSRRGLAVEPMTCPPDAFSTGEDLLVIAPDETVVARWEYFAI